ncbi:MAG: UDP-N-acetylmuramate dehydrogenase [Gammaproteobacteria bacterium]|nr:UDP-N-acetylmuramate dehydrogenase [Gammaproteobacteria bacterium]MDH3449515.1 UDP-N-acetylmuramate dehydrogenase [Gammaproteobacteria bacterium]
MNVAGKQSVRGKLRFDEPMSKHTSWRLGGPADRYYVPTDLQDLQDFLADLESDIEIVWVGLGSNLLVRDGGIRGQVIAPLNALREIRLEADGSLYCECGVSCAKLAKFCQKHELAGADFFAGIPGTIGGALAMNAGAFGGETWADVESVIMIDRHGKLAERSAADFEVQYRQVRLPLQEWFAAARFRFGPRAPGEKSNIRQLLKQRNATQPIGEPSCGSVFKNPPGKYAAQLIEAAGLKGFCLGTACVSEKHANFIISRADTTASDVEALIEHVRRIVADRFDVDLEPEVHIVGETL